jgi:alkylation response protein AidB-like acyl-CoA dehydrogenase
VDESGRSNRRPTVVTELILAFGMEERRHALPAANDYGEPPATMALTESGGGSDLQAALDTDRGGCGYSTEFSVERYVDDASLVIVGESTNEIQRHVIVRQLIQRHSVAS